MCKVSIVLPVYNVAPYIKGTIESLLNQTYKCFELLVIDDCSTDNTVEKILTFSDPRLRLIKNPYNMGRAATDNAALDYIRGQYIAKMDGDDICHPTRLARQVDYLDANPDINIVGSFMQNFGTSTYLNRYPEHPADTKTLTLFTLPTGNPSMMMRSNLFQVKGMRYDDNLRQTEDYDFCARYITQLSIATIQEPLLQYRVPLDSRKKSILTERADVSDIVREQLLIQWGIPFNNRELFIHNCISMIGRIKNISIDLFEIENWLQKMLYYNAQHNFFEQHALQRRLGERWFEVCYVYKRARIKSLLQYYQSPLSDFWLPSRKQQFSFWLQKFKIV